MNLLAFIDQLGAPQPAAPTARRTALARLGQAGWRTAAAAVPAALLPSALAARPTSTALDAVLLLLQLERTQIALYTRALAAPGLLPAAQALDFRTLLAHQQAHVVILTRALTEGGAAVPPVPTFDFSGRRGVATRPELFPAVFSNYADFLQLAQQLEDVGGRTYLGLLPLLAAQRPLYVAALQMLAVETRHASHLRTLRQGQGAAVKNWATAVSTSFPPIVLPPAAAALTAATATGEDGTRQIFISGTGTSAALALVPFDTLLVAANNAVVQPTATAEAFDEPIIPAVAQAALDLFVA